MSATHDQIARASNVSRAAVSQVLKDPDHPRFSQETRQRIIKAARDLNYVPNRLAMGLRQGATQVLGLVMPFNVPELMDTAQQEANRLGYAFIPQFTFKPDAEAERRALTTLLEHRVDGIIWQPSNVAAAYKPIWGQLKRYESRIVCLEGAVEGLETDLVRTDTGAASELAIDHLKAQGYERLVYITCDQRYPIRRRRREEVERICPDAVVLVNEDNAPQLALEQIGKMPGKGPVGVYCDGDFAAVRLVQEAVQIGLRVPEDLGVIGLNDMLVGGHMRATELSRPTVSAIRRHHDQIARACIGQVIKRCERAAKNEITPAQTFKIDPTLIYRESTARRGTAKALSHAD